MLSTGTAFLADKRECHHGYMHTRKLVYMQPCCTKAALPRREPAFQSRRRLGRHRPAAQSVVQLVRFHGDLPCQGHGRQRQSAAFAATAWPVPGSDRAPHPAPHPPRQPPPARPPATGLAQAAFWGCPAPEGRKAAIASQADPVVTAQLEAINNKLQSIVGLRNDIQDLHDSIEVLSGAVDALLKANRGSIDTAVEEEEPQAVHQSLEPEISETADAE